MNRLLLVATRFELSRLDAPAGFDVALTGCGPVDAGIGALAALHAHPGTELCVLAGIGGAFHRDDSAFHEVDLTEVVEGVGFRIADVGIGDTRGFEEATAFTGLEFKQVEMLTVCTPSETAEEALRRSVRWPVVRVEEMEGYAVARACRLAQVPFTCLRAISNVAGCRDKDQWEIEGAMRALSEALGAVR